MSSISFSNPFRSPPLHLATVGNQAWSDEDKKSCFQIALKVAAVAAFVFVGMKIGFLVITSIVFVSVGVALLIREVNKERANAFMPFISHMLPQKRKPGNQDPQLPPPAVPINRRPGNRDPQLPPPAVPIDRRPGNRNPHRPAESPREGVNRQPGSRDSNNR